MSWMRKHWSGCGRRIARISECISDNIGITMAASRTKRRSARALPETRVTQKGQVTIPLEIRELLGLKPRDRVRFEVIDGKVQIKAATSSLERYFQSVPVPYALDLASERQEFEEAMAEDGDARGRA